MSNIFFSLKNINNLIDFNKNISALKYTNKLVNDLTKLLNESDFYDTEIKVGDDQEVRTFKVHSNILKARSSYFKAALSNNWVKRSDNGVILFDKENVSPSIFEILLM